MTAASSSSDLDAASLRSLDAASLRSLDAADLDDVAKHFNLPVATLSTLLKDRKGLQALLSMCAVAAHRISVVRLYLEQRRNPALELCKLENCGAISHVARQPSQSALLSAVGEHWLYSYADLHVYSSHSGFPRTAAVRALTDSSIHTCFHYEGPTFAEQQKGLSRPKRECNGPWTAAALGARHAAGL